MKNMNFATTCNRGFYFLKKKLKGMRQWCFFNNLCLICLPLLQFWEKLKTS